MSRRNRLAVWCGTAMVAAAPATAAAVVAPAKAGPPTSFGEADARAGVLIVTFADTPSAAAAAARLAGLGTVRVLAPEAGVWLLDPDRPEGARERALGRQGVRAVEWPLVRRAAERPIPAPPLPSVPPVQAITDPLFVHQWALWTGDWSQEFTGRQPRPIIAILDSGLDLTHPEWSAANGGAIVGARSVVAGRNPADASDWGQTGHGTHVAGIAAAPADGVGIVGVAPVTATSQLMPVQVADRYGEFRDDDMMEGIRWAVLNGAKIINISAGGTGFSQAFQRTINWASRRGAIITAAVGNEGDADNERLYPAGYRRVLGVGAQCGPKRSLDCPQAYGPATFSQHNDTVDLIAPGVDVLSTVPEALGDDDQPAGYAHRDGTSMAAPYVAGVIALLQAANGNTLTPSQVLRHLEATADDMGPTGRDDSAGWGAVNIRRALSTTVPPDDTAEVNDDIPYLTRATDLAASRTPQVVEADIDVRDDPDDVYPVMVRAGQTVRVEVTSTTGRVWLYLWAPGTRTVGTGERNMRRHLLRFSGRRGLRQVAVVRARSTGRMYANVYAARGATPYTMRITVSR